MSTTNSYYSFLPYVRQGLSGSITNADHLGSGTSGPTERAQIQVKLDIERTPVSGSAQTQTVTQDISLVGPGDITGISSRAIVRVSPRDWTTNFEPNYLPFIEFYDEDFPWRYTPAAPYAPSQSNTRNNKIRPWITLVVLKENEFQAEPFNGILQSITILGTTNSNPFPDEEQIWAWAHVHVNQDFGDHLSTPMSTVLNDLGTTLTDAPDRAVSRIICPRRLEPNASYHAFLIPSFEVGRRAGLGLSTTATGVNALTPSWAGSPVGIEFPVYYQWFFKTGAAGDFESLVRALSPRVMDDSVGKRDMDIQLPGDPTLDLTSPVPTLGLEGALKHAAQVSDTWQIPDSSNEFVESLRDLLNLPETIQQQQSTNYPDPIITPPIYGRWHAAVKSLNTTSDDWIHRVNLDPRYRAFAGAGAEVVRKNQELYMNIAWEQVGAVMEANQAIRNLQVAHHSSQSLFERNIAAATNEYALVLTSNVHAKVKNGNTTVYQQVSQSRVPNTFFSGAFRRLTRPNGGFLRIIDPTGIVIDTATLLTDINTTAVTTAPVYTYPSSQISYTILPASSLTASYTQSVPQQSNYTITNPGATIAAAVLGNDSANAAAFRSAAAQLHTVIQSLAGPASPAPSLNIPTTATAMVSTVNPDSSIVGYAATSIEFVSPVGTITHATSLDTVMAAPSIAHPMYKALAEMSPDLLMPNLNSLPQNSITLLEVNQKVIEAYMLGLNHEMSRELLWREYPTDQRGTYFRHFWDVVDATPNLLNQNNTDSLKDIKPIHQWKTGTVRNDLGENSARTTPPEDLIVLTIRGDLFKKYPNVVISAQKALWLRDANDNALLNLSRELDHSAGSVVYPLFTAKVEPDIYFIGFPISESNAKGTTANDSNPGYFFVLQERAGEIRFGLDEFTGSQNPLSISNWNSIEWGHLINNTNDYPHINTSTAVSVLSNSADVHWGSNSADMAYALYQPPVQIAVHAKEMLPS